MTSDFLAKRQLILEALQGCSIPMVEDPSIRRRLANPNEDVTFAALEADSLTRMEICIFVELRTGLALSIGDLEAHPSVNTLAEYLGVRLAGVAG